MKNRESEKIKIFDNEYEVMKSFKGLKTIEELQSYLPEMKGDLFRKLKMDIKKNGMNGPILYIQTDDGNKLVVEGHTRLTASIEIKKLKNIPTKEISEKFESLDDVKLWMMKHQFQRRNMSSVEKLNLAFLSKKTVIKRTKQNLAKAGKGEEVTKAVDTNKEIAKLTGVSRATGVRYNRVINSASDSVKQAMLKGNISISAAVKSLDKSPIKKQPSPEKKEQQIKMLLSHEEGIKSLNDGEIEALIILNDLHQIDRFNSNQIGRFGFLFIDNQQYEPLIKRSKLTEEDLSELEENAI